MPLDAWGRLAMFLWLTAELLTALRGSLLEHSAAVVYTKNFMTQVGVEPTTDRSLHFHAGMQYGIVRRSLSLYPLSYRVLWFANFGFISRYLPRYL